jgi:hypothetical protein
MNYQIGFKNFGKKIHQSQERLKLNIMSLRQPKLFFTISKGTSLIQLSTELTMRHSRQELNSIRKKEYATMDNQFVSPAQSFLLKEMGFDSPCFGYYTHNERLSRYGSNEIGVDFRFCTHKDIYHTYCLAPTHHQAMGFLMPKLDGKPDYRVLVKKSTGAYLLQHCPEPLVWETISDGTNEDCIKKIIEIVNR